MWNSRFDGFRGHTGTQVSIVGASDDANEARRLTPQRPHVVAIRVGVRRTAREFELCAQRFAVERDSPQHVERFKRENRLRLLAYGHRGDRILVPHARFMHTDEIRAGFHAVENRAAAARIDGNRLDGSLALASIDTEE